MYVTDMENNQVYEFSVSQATTTVGPSSGPGASAIMGTVSQSTLMLIGIIIIVGVVLAVVTLRRRNPRRSVKGVKTDVKYCMECGAQNPAANQFCRKCGTNLNK